MTVAAHIVGGRGDLHALPLEMRANMSKEEAEPYVYATQWFCAGVATYILFIWTLKLNMLFLYQRIVKGLWVEKFIKPAIFIVVAAFIAIMLILFCACRPYHRMWIVYPDQGGGSLFLRSTCRNALTLDSSHLSAPVCTKHGASSGHECCH